MLVSVEDPPQRPCSPFKRCGAASTRELVRLMKACVRRRHAAVYRGLQQKRLQVRPRLFHPRPASTCERMNALAVDPVGNTSEQFGRIICVGIAHAALEQWTAFGKAATIR